MKIRKMLIFAIVSILILAAFSGVSSARISILQENLKDHGKVSFLKEKDEYLIKGHNGVNFLGKMFYTYLPINLPPEYQAEGKAIEFTGEISFRKLFTLDGIWHIIRGILPIKLIEINEHEPLLIHSPLNVSEGVDFTIRVTDDIDNPIENAMVTVSWLKCIFYTNSDGYLKLKSPLVESHTRHYISASKEGYVSDNNEIIIINNNPQKFSITSPQNGATIEGMVEVVVSFSNYDPLVVEVRINDGEWHELECIIGCSIGPCSSPDNCLPAECSGNCIYKLDTNELNDGKHKIEARLFNGNYSYDSIYVYVANNIPVIYGKVTELVSDPEPPIVITGEGGECDDRCESVNEFDPRVQEPDWIYCDSSCCWEGSARPISAVCGYNSGEKICDHRCETYPVIPDPCQGNGTLVNCDRECCGIEPQCDPETGICYEIDGVQCGYCVTEDPKPIANATVLAFPSYTIDAISEMPEPYFETKTDANGRYSLNVVAGNLEVVVVKNGYEKAEKIVSMLPGEHRNLDFQLKKNQNPDTSVIYGTVTEFVSEPEPPIVITGEGGECDGRCESVNEFDPRVQEPDWVYCDSSCCWEGSARPISAVCGYNSGEKPKPCDPLCEVYPVIQDPCEGNGTFVSCDDECCGLEPHCDPETGICVEPVGAQCGYCVMETPVEPIPIANASVLVYPLYPDIPSDIAPSEVYEPYYNTLTDENGNYSIEVKPGTYEVVVIKEGYEKKSKALTVQPEEKKKLDFQLSKIQNTKPIKFDISLKQQIFAPGEPIYVFSTLTNVGKTEIRVNEMDLSTESLDFRILTPDGKIIHYIGPLADCYPPSINLEPGEKHTIKIDLTDKLFPFGENYEQPYKFTTNGEYKIKGYYRSFGKSCDNPIQYEDIWIGNLASQESKFTIQRDIPNN
jgi:hypothetical protein